MREEEAKDASASSQEPSAQVVHESGGLASVSRARTKDAVTIVREALVDEVDALHALINIAYRRESRILPGPRILKEDLSADLADGANLFLVAEQEGEIVGTIRVRFEDGPAGAPPCPYFGLFAVTPQLQGQGIGRKLVAAVEDAARSLGHGAVHLDCARDLGMCGYYEALGYRALAESAGIYLSFLKPFTLVTMKKSLRDYPVTAAGNPSTRLSAR